LGLGLVAGLNSIEVADIDLALMPRPSRSSEEVRASIGPIRGAGRRSLAELYAKLDEMAARLRAFEL
jgi:hypothetical protein